jgi:uncharacterized protein (UPF0210 family)
MTEKEYLLICLIEELSEVQKAITKSLRFGLDDYPPNTDYTNDIHIINEINDVYALFEMVNSFGIIRTVPNEKKIQKKIKKVKRYMKYSQNKGILI